MARRPTRRGRSTIGRIGKKQETKIEGLEELKRNLRRMSDQARVQILEGAVAEGATETLLRMQQAAPESRGKATHGRHGADLLDVVKIFSRRDSRSVGVGITKPRGAWWLKFAEHGTIHHPADPFIRPTARVMRPKMLKIIEKHWRKAVRRGIRGVLRR